MEWLVFWLIVNLIVGYVIGAQKNDVGTAIVLSVLLGPIGWLIALVSRGKLRKCPFCAEHIKPEAIVCRHCGRDVPSAAAQREEKPFIPKKITRGEVIALGLLLIVFIIVWMAAMLAK